MKDPTPLIFLGSGLYSNTVARQHLVGPDCPYAYAGLAQNLDPDRRGETYEGVRVYALNELPPLAATHQAICLLGDCEAKQRFVEQVIPMGFSFASIVHASAFVSPAARLGEGALVAEGTILPWGIEVGSHCFFSAYVVLGEGARVGDYCCFSTGVKVAGSVTIGSRVFVGINATISDHITIGDGATVGAGAVVIRDVPTGATVVGNPAREIRRRPQDG